MVGNEITLLDAVKDFEANSYAILYSSDKCYLALFDGVKFVDEKGELDITRVFEARIFNSEKELRWLNESGGKGVSIVISDASFSDAIERNKEIKYLFWGKKNGEPANGWTQFAEARIGAFYVPKEIFSDYAQFTAIEYLGEFADGNIAVIDERLTGISEMK